MRFSMKIWIMIMKILWGRVVDHINCHDDYDNDGSGGDADDEENDDNDDNNSDEDNESF